MCDPHHFTPANCIADRKILQTGGNGLLHCRGIGSRCKHGEHLGDHGVGGDQFGRALPHSVQEHRQDPLGRKRGYLLPRRGIHPGRRTGTAAPSPSLMWCRWCCRVMARACAEMPKRSFSGCCMCSSRASRTRLQTPVHPSVSRNTAAPCSRAAVSAGWQQHALRDFARAACLGQAGRAVLPPPYPPRPGRHAAPSWGTPSFCSKRSRHAVPDVYWSLYVIAKS